MKKSHSDKRCGAQTWTTSSRRDHVSLPRRLPPPLLQMSKNSIHQDRCLCNNNTKIDCLLFDADHRRDESMILCLRRRLLEHAINCTVISSVQNSTQKNKQHMKFFYSVSLFWRCVIFCEFVQTSLTKNGAIACHCVSLRDGVGIALVVVQ